MEYKYLVYNEAKSLIKEADVLLFRAPISLFSVGFYISRYTQGIYSHVGLATVDDYRQPNIIEQKEFKGGRILLLRNSLKNEIVDVFRINSKIVIPKLVKRESVNCVENEYKFFDGIVAKKVTDKAKDLIKNIPSYGYSNIWKILRSYTPFLRLQIHKEDDLELTDSYVCSTLVVHSYRACFHDLCPFINDEMTSPNDVSRSALLHYVFSITE